MPTRSRKIQVMHRVKDVVFIAAVVAVAMLVLGRPSERIASLDSDSGLPSRFDGPAATALPALPGGSEAPGVRGIRTTDPPDPPDPIAELREQIAKILTDYNIPGVGLALVDGEGVIWSGGVGLANRETGAKVDGDTVFRVASISKTVIALALLRLVDQGRVTLDARLADIAPEIIMANRWSESDPVTVAHLFEHTAGFDDMRFNEMFTSDDDLSLAEVLAINPRSRTSRWRPGSRHAYSNPGYTVAAYVIEKIAGEPFEDYIEREILRPAGMESASFRSSSQLRDRLAQGYSGNRSRPVSYRRLYHRPAGELLASASELAQLVQLFLRRGAVAGQPLVSEKAIARMERSETTSLPSMGIEYGLGNYGDTSLPVITRGHDGGLPGFVSQYRYSVDMGIGYVMLFNSTSPSVESAYFAVRRLLFQFLTEGRGLPPPPSIDVPQSELEHYVGYYDLESSRHQIVAFLDRVVYGAEAFIRAGKLHLKLGNGVDVVLIPTAPGRFRVPGHSGAAIAFDSLDDGTPIMVLGGLYYERGSELWGPIRQKVVGISIWLMDVGVFGIIAWLPGWIWVMLRVRQRMPLPPGSLATLASLCFMVMMRIFDFGFSNGALGAMQPLSISLFVSSLLFPLLSVLAVVQSIRWLTPGSQVQRSFLDLIVDKAGFWSTIYQQGWRSNFYSAATSLACLAMALFFAFHGFIALRTWAW